MIKLGSTIICKDGKRFMVAEMPNEEWVLVDLDTNKIRFVDDVIVSYINAYHLGIAYISDGVIIK